MTVCQLDDDGDPDLHGANFSQPLIYNHLRSLASLQVPLPGGQLVLRTTHAAGFAPAGLAAAPCLSFAPRSMPLSLPGIEGRFAISLAVGAMLPLQVLAAPTGRADVAISIPPLPEFVGVELFAQALFLPGPGLAAAWSPVVNERIGWR